MSGVAPELSSASRPAPCDAAIAVVAGEAQLRDRITAALVEDGLVVVQRGWDASSIVVEHADAPNVIVLGCDAPERRSALTTVNERFADTAVVVVAPRASRQTVRKLVEAGGAALVLEGAIERSLALAVRCAHAGQLSVPLDLSVGLDKPVLSSREKQILGMVVMGFTNAEIAKRLFLAESTIKSHLSSVFAKLGVRSRKEPAALVLDTDSGLGTGILAISSAEEDS